MRIHSISVGAIACFLSSAQADDVSSRKFMPILSGGILMCNTEMALRRYIELSFLDKRLENKQAGACYIQMRTPEIRILLIEEKQSAGPIRILKVLVSDWVQPGKKWEAYMLASRAR